MVSPRVLGLVVVDLPSLGCRPALLVVGDGFAAVGRAAVTSARLTGDTAGSQCIAVGAKCALEALTRGNAAAAWCSGRLVVCWRWRGDWRRWR